MSLHSKGTVRDGVEKRAPVPLKWYRKLESGKNRRETGMFLVEGKRALDQIMRTQPDRIVEIVTTGEPVTGLENVPHRFLKPAQFRSISSVKHPQGVLAVARLPAAVYDGALPRVPGQRVLVLEDIQDPGNVGTLIRSAAALGYDGCLLSEGCADPFAPKCVQASAGTIFSVWIKKTNAYLTIVGDLRARGYRLLGTDMEGSEDPPRHIFEGAILLAMGNEGAGLSRDLRSQTDFLWSVPIQRNRAESLNVAASGAICMYLSREG